MYCAITVGWLIRLLLTPIKRYCIEVSMMFNGIQFVLLLKAHYITSRNDGTNDVFVRGAHSHNFFITRLLTLK